MRDLLRHRRIPFVVVLVLTFVISIAVFRLPDSFVVQLENSQTFSISQRGWAFRLLAFAALAQAFYVGFAIFRPERVKHARETDRRVIRLTRERLMRSLARNAAGAIVLTLIYGLAAFAVTGFRAGFWLFVFVVVVQAAWYYRQTGEIGRWLAFQPETADQQVASAIWIAAPPDYCPPIARALTPSGTLPASED